MGFTVHAFTLFGFLVLNIKIHKYTYIYIYMYVHTHTHTHLFCFFVVFLWGGGEFAFAFGCGGRGGGGRAFVYLYGIPFPRSVSREVGFLRTSDKRLFQCVMEVGGFYAFYWLEGARGFELDIVGRALN